MNGNGDLVGPPRWVWRFLLIATLVVMFGVGYFVVTHDTASTASVEQVTAVVKRLEKANAQRQCDSAALSKSFAVILELLAENFETPPAPDPSRLKAVQGLRDAAAAFSAAAPVPCPKAQ